MPRINMKKMKAALVKPSGTKSSKQRSPIKPVVGKQVDHTSMIASFFDGGSTKDTGFNATFEGEKRNIFRNIIVQQVEAFEDDEDQSCSNY